MSKARGAIHACYSIAQNLAGPDLRGFLDTVDAAKLVYVDVQLSGDGIEAIAALHFVVVLASGCSGRLLTAASIFCGRFVVRRLGGSCIAAVCVFAERVEIAGDVLRFKVKEQCRVNGFTEQSGFKMQVRTERTPGISAESNGLTGTDFVVYAYQLLGEVAVDGFQSVGVTQKYIVAITAGIVLGYAYPAVKSCIIVSPV